MNCGPSVRVGLRMTPGVDPVGPTEMGATYKVKGFSDNLLSSVIADRAAPNKTRIVGITEEPRSGIKHVNILKFSTEGRFVETVFRVRTAVVWIFEVHGRATE